MSLFIEKQETSHRVFFSQEFNFPPHLHHDVEFIYVYEGELTIKHNFKKVLLKKEEGIIFFPNNIHEYCTDSQGKFIIGVFSQNLMAEFIPLFAKNEPVDNVFTLKKYKQDFFSCLDYFLIEEANNFLTKGKTYLLFSIILKELTLTPLTTKTDESLIVKIVQYVSQHYQEPITLNIIANEVGCSYHTVSRVFSEKLALNFRDYLNHLRVDDARRLLQETDLSILEVALEAGFESLRTFNRYHAKVFGYSPRDYRKQVKP